MTAKLVDWDPRKEPDKLAGLAMVAAAMHDGRHAMEARLEEFAGGYPTGRRGGGSADAGDDDDAPDPVTPEDVAKRERREFERELATSFDAACRAWDRYRRVVEPRAGVVKLTDPGCELCAQVPGHWCPVYGVRVIMSEPKTKRDKATVRTLRLCVWCFHMTYQSRAGRLPTDDEVTAHSEGRRVNWKGGTAPRLVEVACPDCHDENRQARRDCKTCGHTGKVLKASAQ